MATNSRWVISCKNCLGECTYADIPPDLASYFLPKKPEVPDGFSFKCPNCAHEDAYDRNDLTYRDETMPSRIASTKCTSAEASRAARGSK
jgi:hypothetical protein